MTSGYRRIPQNTHCTTLPRLQQAMAGGLTDSGKFSCQRVVRETNSTHFRDAARGHIQNQPRGETVLKTVLFGFLSNGYFL